MDVRTLLDKIISDAELGEKAPGRALRWPLLRPYLPDRHALTRLAAGSRVLCGYALRGLRRAVVAVFTEDAKKPPTKAEKPGTGEKDTSKKRKKAEKKAPPAKATPKADWLERAAIGLFGSLVGGIVLVTALAAVGPHVRPYLPIATGVVVLAWVAAAWIVAPEPAPKKATPSAEEPSSQDTTERDRRSLLHMLDAATAGRNGVHLGELHRWLIAHPTFQGLQRHHVGPLLEDFAVPYQRTLSVDGIEGRSGVRRADVDALLLALPQERQAPPSQPSESDPDLRESQPLSTDSQPTLGPVSGGV